jgi:hypothetical protein
MSGGELELLCALGVFVQCGHRILIAAVGADKRIYHQLQGSGDPLPMHGTNNHDAATHMG